MTLNLAHVGETAGLILLAYLLGCVVGYGARRMLRAASGQRRGRVTQPIAVSPAPAAVVTPKAVPSPARRLAARAAVDDVPLPPVPVKTNPAPMSADNLRLIKGIGPKLEESLHALGVYRFEQIAAWSAADVERVEAQLAFRGRIGRDRWVEQAASLVRRAA